MHALDYVDIRIQGRGVDVGRAERWSFHVFMSSRNSSWRINLSDSRQDTGKDHLHLWPTRRVSGREREEEAGTT